MVVTLETDMSSVVILYMILIQGVFGTYFPPVNNPPPIPARSVRTLNKPPQGFYVQENLPQDFPPSFLKEGLFTTEEKVENQRWYLQEPESQSSETSEGSSETFDRYYQSGEPAIGPVATPIPDDTYLSQPSSISKLNPNEPVNSDVWILTRRPYNQYVPNRWVQVQQLPAERFVEVVNQDPEPPLATEKVKSVAAPVPPEVPVKTQFTANTLANIIQQIWVRSPNSLGSRVFGNPSDILDDIPSVKQIIDIPTGNVKQIVKQQVIKDGSDVPFPSPLPAPSPLVSKKTFSPPPPPPPPLKGFDPTSKSGPPIPVNTIPDSSVLIGDDGLFQRVRYVWVPTSPTTGKFISFPVRSSFASAKTITNAGLPLDSTPLTVSDTWVLKQDGPVPSFERKKSPFPPPEIQGGNVIFQDPPVIRIDAPPNPPIIAQIDSPKNPKIGKSVDSKPPFDIWPAKKDTSNSKLISKTQPAIIPQSLLASPKPDEIIITKSLVPPIPLQSPKYPQLIPPPSSKVLNGKPCPIPLPPPLQQKYFLSPRSPTIIAVPRLMAPQRRPLAQIVRVNRYPSGSYYLLNNRIRPNFLSYPNAPLVQSKIVRLVQTNQIPLSFPNKQPTLPLKAKQIPIPPQSKQYPAPVPAKQIIFPFGGRQIAAPLPSPKSSRIIYPAIQAMKYTYPWNSKNSPVPGKGVYLSPFSPQILPIPSTSSSSESSSESSSPESEDKKEKLKKEEKPKKEENGASDEREKESSSEETDASKQVKSEEESIEAAESQAHPEVSNPNAVVVPHHDPEVPQTDGIVTEPNHHNHDSAGEGLTNEPSDVTHDKANLNIISNHVTNSDDKTHLGSEGSTEDITTAFVRD